MVAAAKRHGMPTVALIVATPASVCVERQRPRPANQIVPDDTVDHRAGLPRTRRGPERHGRLSQLQAACSGAPGPALAR
ncbi:ATP-binding protein [Actinacidiphila oryziradicis]|uniref:ATP-binding protein n=1 Tax=Actinacidiphila oryziradicis TaxID=2571141 RepID=A0A4U0RF55_9ACTN|nr:ATP-binding protein [Actinacidiphila oryziradicis]